MRVLLDTHVLLWWYGQQEKINKTTQDIIISAGIVFVSAVSTWELAEKVRKGKIKLPVSLGQMIKLDIFSALPVTFEHVETYQRLTVFHKNPFDRMLVAQALTEDASLISIDEKIGNYPVQLIRP